MSCLTGPPYLKYSLPFALDYRSASMPELNLEEEVAENLGKAISNLKKLIILELNLKDSMLSNDGLKFLGKALRSQPELKNLDLNLQQ